MSFDGKAVLLLGATGYTGRLVVQSLDRLKQAYVLSGRDPKKLEEPAARLGNLVDIRIADLSRPEDLRGLFAGVAVLINTAGPFGGPFAERNAAVVEAAIAQGVHYIDVSAEQAFARSIYERFHRPAIKAGVTVMTGQGLEYAFSYCAAAILNQRCGPLAGVNCHYMASDCHATRGTLLSALTVAGQEFVEYSGGRLQSQRRRATPEKLRFPGEKQTFYALPFPGAEAVMLPVDFPQLQHVHCYGLLPKTAAYTAAPLSLLHQGLRPLFGTAAVQRLGQGWIRRRRDPDGKQRSRSRWSVFVEGLGASGVHVCKISGRDPYASSADAAALAAVKLAAGEGRGSGVMTTGRAFDAMEFLDALKTRGVKWELR